MTKSLKDLDAPGFQLTTIRSNMNTESVLTGGCFCRRVTFRFNGKPGKVAFCHCETCRSITGAPVTVAVMGSSEQLEFTATEPKYFESSNGVKRGFCDGCGTPICWVGQWHGNGHAFVYAGTLDNIEMITPDRHAFHRTSVSWLAVNTDLPVFPETSPEGALE